MDGTLMRKAMHADPENYVTSMAPGQYWTWGTHMRGMKGERSLTRHQDHRPACSHSSPRMQAHARLCTLMQADAGWCIMAAVLIPVQVSLFDSKSALWNKSSFIYVALQSTRCLPPLAGSLLVLGLQGALLLHSSSSHPCPPTPTPTRRPTTTTTCTSLGRRQASARWGPQRSGVSWTCTTPSPRLARSDAFRCPLRGRQPS